MSVKAMLFEKKKKIVTRVSLHFNLCAIGASELKNNAEYVNLNDEMRFTFFTILGNNYW